MDQKWLKNNAIIFEILILFDDRILQKTIIDYFYI